MGEKITIKRIAGRFFQRGRRGIVQLRAAPSRKKFAPFAVQCRGAVVVDDSSAFRMDEALVPLVIPDINGADIAKNRGIIANPNCSTAITLMALYPLHKEFGLKRFFASTYQAVSGTGAQAIEELREQIAAVVADRDCAPSVYPGTPSRSTSSRMSIRFLDTG